MVKDTGTSTATLTRKRRWRVCLRACAAEDILKRSRPRTDSNEPMGERKTEKELAFIQDLFIAPDWGERFATLVDEHVKLPDEGRVLYAGSGSGGHALALFGRAGKVQFVCLDENHESIELAQSKSETLKAAVEFRPAKFESLDLNGKEFDLVIADLSLVASERLPAIIGAIVRVAKSNATIAIMLATASSFGEFFSIYWE